MLCALLAFVLSNHNKTQAQSTPGGAGSPDPSDFPYMGWPCSGSDTDVHDWAVARMWVWADQADQYPELGGILPEGESGDYVRVDFIICPEWYDSWRQCLVPALSKYKVEVEKAEARFELCTSIAISAFAACEVAAGVLWYVKGPAASKLALIGCTGQLGLSMVVCTLILNHEMDEAMDDLSFERDKCTRAYGVPMRSEYRMIFSENYTTE